MVFEQINFIEKSKEKYNTFKDIGCVMSLEEFMSNVEDKVLMDYDGSGDLCYEGEMITNASIHCDDKLIIIGAKDSQTRNWNELVSNSVSIHDVDATVFCVSSFYYEFTFENFVKIFGYDGFEVIWYNK